MSEIFGYLIVEKDVDISTLPYENEEYTLLPGSIAYVVGGGAYMLTPSNRWQFLDPEIQKIVLPVFKNVRSSGGGGGGSSGLVVNAVYDDQTDEHTLDKTWNEIKNTVASGGAVYIFSHSEDETSYQYYPVTEVSLNDVGKYLVSTIEDEYIADSADSYPMYDERFD